jgi:hypothetical protein
MTLLCHDVLAMCLLLAARLRAVMALLSHPSQRVAVSQREVQRDDLGDYHSHHAVTCCENMWYYLPYILFTLLVV